MGLILPQTIKIKIYNSNRRYYKEKGYDVKKNGDFIEVNVLDLPEGTHTLVQCECDYCGAAIKIEYRDYIKNKNNNKLLCCNNVACKNKKYEDTCMKKYGVKNVFQTQETKDKIVETNRKNYGVDYPFQSDKVQDKYIKTLTEKYGKGITNVSQLQEVKNKKIETCRKNFGVNHPFQSNEVQDKSAKTLTEKYGKGITNVAQVAEIQEQIRQTNVKRYGRPHALQSEEIKKKMKETNNKKYGGNSPMCSNDIKNKAKITYQLHYGVDNPSKAQEVKDKKKETCQLHYGCDWSLQDKKVREKSIKTWQEHYGEGIINPGQAPEVKDKIFDSFQFNGTGPSSRAQRYICYILNGILNKNICSSLVDIYMEKENIVIEYDGSGHFLKDKMNGNLLPTEKSLLYEKQREDRITNNGYRMIRFIATKERIPSDETIINLIEEFKNSEFKVIRIDFEEGTIEKDYCEKWYRDFGKLRRITKKVLEPFEKQKEKNTLKTSKN